MGLQCDTASKRKIQPQNTSGKGFPAEKTNHQVFLEWFFSSVYEKGKYKQEQVAERAAGLITGVAEKSLQEIAYVEWEKENRKYHCSS